MGVRGCIVAECSGQEFDDVVIFVLDQGTAAYIATRKYPIIACTRKESEHKLMPCCRDLLRCGRPVA